MPLEEQEWDLVRCLVEEFLVGTADPFVPLHQHFPDLVGGWTLKSVPAHNARFLVSQARQARPTDEAPFSLRLLTVLVGLQEIEMQRAAEHAALRRFLERLQAEQAASHDHDPFDALILVSGDVFIDRLPTRTLLRQLARPEPHKPVPLALRVVGGERLGKSYTYSFIVHISGFRDVAAVPVFLDSSYTAADILRDLATKIAPDGSAPREVDDPAKRIRHWADWLVARAIERTEERALWFVFDQCNELDPTSDAVQLIAQLAINVQNPGLHGPPPELRPKLVLLGYGDALPDLQLPRKQVVVDQVVKLEAQQLGSFFSAVFRDIHAHGLPGQPIDEEQLEATVAASVARVLQDAQEAVDDGGCYSRAVNESVADVVDFYREEVGGGASTQQ